MFSVRTPELRLFNQVYPLWFLRDICILVADMKSLCNTMTFNTSSFRLAVVYNFPLNIMIQPGIDSSDQTNSPNIEKTTSFYSSCLPGTL